QRGGPQRWRHHQRLDAQRRAGSRERRLNCRVTIRRGSPGDPGLRRRGGGQVHSTGPDNPNDAGWSVRYEIFAPQTTDLNIKTDNGGITISDVRGQIRFEGITEAWFRSA